MFEWTSLLIELPFVPAVLLKSTAVLAAAWIVHGILRVQNPRWRVLLWRGVTVALVALPVAELAMPSFNVEVTADPVVAAPTLQVQPIVPMPIPESAGIISESLPMPAVETTELPELKPTVETNRVEIHPFHVALVLWAIVGAVLFTRAACAWLRLRKLVAATHPAPEDAAILAKSIAKELGVTAAFQIRTMNHEGSPFLTGVRRPVVVLPQRCIQHENVSRLPAILAHEIAHARTHDVLWIACVRLLTHILWFHPFAWRMRVAHGAACEEVCDGVAADYVGSAEGYSKTLALEALAVQGAQTLRAGVPMIQRAEIIDRLRKIERGIRTNPLARKWVAACLVIGAGLLITLGSLQLVAAQPEDVEEKYPHAIPIETYETSWSKFQPGDTIEIVEVRGTKPEFKEDEEYYVRGTYALTSRESAMLHVYATNGEVESKQGPPVSKGTGEFVRAFKLTKNGMPHVSFYPTNGGDGFGDRYFRRSTKQAEAIPGESLPPIEVDVTNEEAVVRLPGVDVKLLGVLPPSGKLISPSGIPIDPESLGTVGARYSAIPQMGNTGARVNAIVQDGSQTSNNALGLLFYVAPTQNSDRKLFPPSFREVHLPEMGSESMFDLGSIGKDSKGSFFQQIVWRDGPPVSHRIDVQTDVSFGPPLQQIADIPRQARNWEFEFDNRKLVATVERGPFYLNDEAFRVTLKLDRGEPLPNYQVVGIEYDGPTVMSNTNVRSGLNPGEERTWVFPDGPWTPIQEIARFQLIGHQLQPIIWRNVALTAQDSEGGDETAAVNGVQALPAIEVDASTGDASVVLPGLRVQLLGAVRPMGNVVTPKGESVSAGSWGETGSRIIAAFQDPSRSASGDDTNRLGLLFKMESVNDNVYDAFFRLSTLSGAKLSDSGHLRFTDVNSPSGKWSSFDLPSFLPDTTFDGSGRERVHVRVAYGPPLDLSADIPLDANETEIQMGEWTFKATVRNLPDRLPESEPPANERAEVSLVFSEGGALVNYDVVPVAMDGTLVEPAERRELSPLRLGHEYVWKLGIMNQLSKETISGFRLIGHRLQPIEWYNVVLSAQESSGDKPAAVSAVQALLPIELDAAAGETEVKLPGIEVELEWTITQGLAPVDPQGNSLEGTEWGSGFRDQSKRIQTDDQLIGFAFRAQRDPKAADPADIRWAHLANIAYTDGNKRLRLPESSRPQFSAITNYPWGKDMANLVVAAGNPPLPRYDIFAFHDLAGNRFQLGDRTDIRADISYGPPLDLYADIPIDANETEIEMGAWKFKATVRHLPQTEQARQFTEVDLVFSEGGPLENYHVVPVSNDDTVMEPESRRDLTRSDLSRLVHGHKYTWKLRTFDGRISKETIKGFRLVGHPLQPVIWRNVALPTGDAPKG